MPATAPAKSPRAMQKKMRKGTKSCLPCRRRKIRCSGIAPSARACIECISRGSTDCAPQGDVDGSDDRATQRLQDRVAHLEACLERATGLQVPSLSPLPAKEGSGYNVKSSRNASEDEEEVETTYAPLVSLLNPRSSGATPPIFKSSPRSGEDQDVVLALRAHLPTQTELRRIIKDDTSWWPTYRDALGLIWTVNDSMDSFVAEAITSNDPSLTALLLVCLAVSTGEYQRYLPPVEEHIVSRDRYVSTEPGLNALMALGTCYMNSLQPRRAWTTFRRASSLIQLAGYTSQWRRQPDRYGLIFWQLFHADRWVSLMIGLPYTMPDHFCDLTIEPLAVMGPATWLYRKLCVITGRVIDLLQTQDPKGRTLSTAIRIEEQVAEVTAALEPSYLNMESIRSCVDPLEKNTRLYRVIQVHLLRVYLHLPFFLRSEQETRFAASRRSCIVDSRELLVAYLEVHDTDHRMAANGSVLNFTAFTAATILVLGLTGRGEGDDTFTSGRESGAIADLKLVYRTRDIIQCAAQSRIAGRLSAKCHSALNTLLSSVRSSQDVSQRIVLPYFGTVLLNAKSTAFASLQSPTTGPGEDAAAGLRQEGMPPGSFVGTSDHQTGNHSYNAAEDGWPQDLGQSKSFAYSGPFTPTLGNTYLLDDPTVSLSAGYFDWLGGLDPDTDWDAWV